MEKDVGTVVRVVYDTETFEMRITIEIKDEEYKRKILRDFRQSEKLLIKGDNVMAVVGKQEE